MTSKPEEQEARGDVSAHLDRPSASTGSTAAAVEPTSIVARVEYLLEYLRLCTETSKGYALTASTKQRRLCRAVEGATLTVCVVELERVITGEPFGFTLPAVREAQSVGSEADTVSDGERTVDALPIPQEDLPADAARLLRDHAWDLYGDKGAK